MEAIGPTLAPMLTRCAAWPVPASLGFADALILRQTPLCVSEKLPLEIVMQLFRRMGFVPFVLSPRDENQRADFALSSAGLVSSS